MASKSKEQIHKESLDFEAKYGLVGAPEESGLEEGDLILDYTPIGMGRGAVTKAGAQSYEAIKAARLAKEVEKRVRAGMTKEAAKKEVAAAESARKASPTQNYGGVPADKDWAANKPEVMDEPLSGVLENIQRQSAARKAK